MTILNLIKFSLFIILVYSFEVNSKSYEKKRFVCADEIGPVIEFNVPDFNNGQVKRELPFKLFHGDDRKLYFNKIGLMFKQSSPIDNSYSYYKVETILKNHDSFDLFFEFFPPSTLMLKKDKNMFKSLACWNN